ncbi:MAG: hypothetical protein V3S14_10615 [Anaerolineae bacterium]
MPETKWTVFGFLLKPRRRKQAVLGQEIGRRLALMNADCPACGPRQAF